MIFRPALSNVTSLFTCQASGLGAADNSCRARKRAGDRQAPGGQRTDAARCPTGDRHPTGAPLTPENTTSLADISDGLATLKADTIDLRVRSLPDIIEEDLAFEAAALEPSEPGSSNRPRRAQPIRHHRRVTDSPS